ncbi:MAG: hypothetical protein AAF543_14030 [Pseudomonadota bacterium]
MIQDEHVDLRTNLTEEASRKKRGNKRLAAGWAILSKFRAGRFPCQLKRYG